MKYKAKCTNCVSHIKNITKYAEADILCDKKGLFIEVDSEAEAAEIEMINHLFGRVIMRYKKLIELTLKK